MTSFYIGKIFAFLFGVISSPFIIKQLLRKLPVELVFHIFFIPVCNLCGLKVKLAIDKIPSDTERDYQIKRFKQLGDLCDDAYDKGLSGERIK